ncbi:2829_t:CDS:2 [Paraglomus occultum]|uniref:2829_t:CDS:1 n=1 Tax=Paraglomus occultum TaxID=144539 RepID=A0A9N9GS55_9GLOM|nr:2829_t:CDS:2 [Paraglomus occultum]
MRHIWHVNNATTHNVHYRQRSAKSLLGALPLEEGSARHNWTKYNIYGQAMTRQKISVWYAIDMGNVASMFPQFECELAKTDGRTEVLPLNVSIIVLWAGETKKEAERKLG